MFRRKTRSSREEAPGAFPGHVPVCSLNTALQAAQPWTAGHSLITSPPASYPSTPPFSPVLSPPNTGPVTPGVKASAESPEFTGGSPCCRGTQDALRSRGLTAPPPTPDLCLPLCTGGAHNQPLFLRRVWSFRASTPLHRPVLLPPTSFSSLAGEVKLEFKDPQKVMSPL